MAIVNAVFGQVVDILLLPFRALPPLVALVVLSLLAAVGMLWVYKRTSNQKRIAAVKSQIHAGIFEMRLFSDDPGAIFRAQFDVLRHNLAYAGLALVPLAWMIVPFVLLLAQMQMRFGYEGFTPGDETMVRAKLVEGWRGDFAGVPAGGRPPVSLEAPAGVEVLTPAVWLPSLNEVVWKVRVKEPGSHELTVRLGDTDYAKGLRAEPGILRQSPLRHAGGFVDAVLYPAEAPLPAGPMKAIEVDLKEPGFVVGLPQWLAIFFVLSIVFAFALKGPMKVEI